MSGARRGIGRVDAIITRIEPLEREPGFVRLWSAGRSLGVAHLDDVEGAGLRVGSRLDEAAREALAGARDRAEALRRALRLAARRALSKAAIRSRLEAAGLAKEAVDAAMARLEDRALTDDRGVAREAAEARDRRRPASEALVRAELAERGFEDESIEHAAGALEGEGEFDRALRAASGRVPARIADREGERRRLWGFLARRGFDEETAMRVIERLIPEA